MYNDNMHTLDSTLFTLLVLETFKLNSTFVSEGDNLTRDLKLTSARWRVLGAISMAKKALSVSQIAHIMGQSRQGVLRLVNEMQSDQLLSMISNPKRKKSNLFCLSDKGLATYQQLEKRQIAWASKHVNKIPITDLQTTLATLKKISTNINDNTLTT